MFEKPKLIFESKIERRKRIRRLLWNILAMVAALGAWASLFTLRMRESEIDPLLLQVGEIVALGLAAMMLVRALFNFFRALRQRSETLRFFDKGFTWQTGKTQSKYAWGQTASFREGARQIRLGRLLLAQLGAHILEMQDGETFRFTGAHGNTSRFARAVRPYVTEVTGTRMGRALRSNKTVRVHKDLKLTPKGIVAGSHKLPWSKVDVKVQRGRLLVRRLENGKFRVVKTYPVHQIENLGGFLDVARSTIQNHQPKRFNIKTQGPSSSYA